MVGAKARSHKSVEIDFRNAASRLSFRVGFCSVWHDHETNWLRHCSLPLQALNGPEASPSPPELRRVEPQAPARPAFGTSSIMSLRASRPVAALAVPEADRDRPYPGRSARRRPASRDYCVRRDPRPRAFPARSSGSTCSVACAFAAKNRARQSPPAKWTRFVRNVERTGYRVRAWRRARERGFGEQKIAAASAAANRKGRAPRRRARRARLRSRLRRSVPCPAESAASRAPARRSCGR